MGLSVLSSRWLGIGVAYIVVAAVAFVLIVGSSNSAHALGSVEPGTPPCTGMLQFGNAAADPGIRAAGVAATVAQVQDPAHADRTVDQVRVSWDSGLTDKGVVCVWITSKPPTEAQFRTEADMIAPADATSYTVSPIGAPGKYCYRVVPVSLKAAGEATDVCVDVQHPRQISTDDTPPASSPTPGSASQPTSPPKAPDTGSGATSGDRTAAVLLVGFGTAIAAFAVGGLVLVLRRRHAQLP